MTEKIKAFFSSIGSYLVLGSVAVIGLVIVYIVRLKDLVSSLSSKNAVLETEKEISDIQEQKKELENESTNSINQYYAVRDAYLRSIGLRPPSDKTSSGLPKPDKDNK